MKHVCNYILIIICNLTSFCYGQNAVKIRLLYQSADIHKSNNEIFDIKRVRHSNNSDSVFVRLKNKKILLLPQDKIWGFQDDDSIIYRNFKGVFYRVLQIDTLAMYSQKKGKYNHYYFSQGSDGKLLDLSDENLKKVFSNNICFLNKIENGFKWYQDYSSYNDKTKSYRMIEYFNSCKEDIK